MKKNFVILGASSDIGIELIKFLIKKDHVILQLIVIKILRQLQKLKKII